jgi:hypothetical protein
MKRKIIGIANPLNTLRIKQEINVLEQPVYEPDLIPCDFFLFPAIKSQLKGPHFDT